MADVVIVDYGMGNLASVEFACERAGLTSVVSSSPELVAHARGVVLPGVGAFGDAMQALRRRGLDEAVVAAAGRGCPVLGVCLGMQLLATESTEFGRHRGLGLIEGDVVRLESDASAGVKVPHVGWAPLRPAEPRWSSSPLRDLEPATHMYFVHSYVLRPADTTQVTSWTPHGRTHFCSSLVAGSVFACQFHPERSGAAGLAIYREVFQSVTEQVRG